MDRKTRNGISLLIVLALFVFSGAACPKRFSDTYATPTPVVLPENASFQDVARVVNANAERIQQLQVSNGTLTTPGRPSLQASYAMDGKNRFRLTADAAFLGRQIDLGSNDEIYWMWLQFDPSNSIYFGRHEEFYRSAARRVLPVPPQWLAEALGVVRFDPTGHHDGPVRRNPGQLEIRSILLTPNGELERIATIDDRHGWVLQLQLFDRNSTNQLLASAVASDFNYYPEAGVFLPRTVQIQLPPADLQFTLQSERHMINQLYADTAQLFSMPQPDGATPVNLNSISSPPPRYVEPQVQYAPAGDNRFRHPVQRHALRRLPPMSDRYR